MLNNKTEREKLIGRNVVELGDKFPIVKPLLEANYNLAQKLYKRLKDNENLPAKEFIETLNDSIETSIIKKDSPFEVIESIKNLTLAASFNYSIQMEILHFALCFLGAANSSDNNFSNLILFIKEYREQIIRNALENEELDLRINRSFNYSEEQYFNNEIISGSFLEETKKVTNQEKLEKGTGQIEDKETTSLRRMVIALMLLTFGRIDRPEDIEKERIVEFFHWVTGRPKKGLRDLLADPTKHKGVPRSVTKVCSDLNFVRNELGKMGITDKVQNTINEIEFILDGIKDN